jgi:shikimate dehydrogenase
MPGWRPTARTRVVAVIGDPVDHSRSPAMHNAAFRALGLDWVYVAFPVPRGRGADAVRAVRTLGLAGMNVTMPHKDDAAGACDELDDEALPLGAVNTVVVGTGGALVGHATDGPGFLRALADEGVDAAGRRCLVAGGGGAGRAISRALGNVGARVTVAARRLEAAERAAALAGGEAVKFPDVEVESFDVVVNATPLGMAGEPPPFDAERLQRGQFVYDTVYPAETPLLAAARARGIAHAGGIGMLVHQGARSFRLWTGQEPPLDLMRAAALEP